MKEEKKKRESEKKIVEFDIDESVMTDAEIDRFLAESLQKEADELEAELNQDPNLIGADVSNEMFQSIVRQLKERGIWEEEEASRVEAVTPQGKIQRTVKAVPQGEIQRTEEAVPQGEIQRAEGTAPQGEIQKTEGAMRQGEVQKTELVSQQTEGRNAKNMEDEGRVEQEEREISDAQQQKSEAPQSLEELYAMLPEKDRRALALGKQIEKMNETRALKRKKRRKVFKYSGVAAAILVFVFSGSMTIEANRRLVQKAWGGVMYNLGFRVSTDYTDEGMDVESRTKEEIEAMEEIGESLDIPVIGFDYMPKEMKYRSYDIRGDNSEATVFYDYQEKIFSVTLISLDKESVSYYTLDNEAVFRDTIFNRQEIEAKIWEANLDKEEETYIVTIDYDDCRYILNGMISLDEMKKIVKSAFIL